MRPSLVKAHSFSRSPFACSAVELPTEVYHSNTILRTSCQLISSQQKRKDDQSCDLARAFSKARGRTTPEEHYERGSRKGTTKDKNIKKESLKPRRHRDTGNLSLAPSFSYHCCHYGFTRPRGMPGSGCSGSAHAHPVRDGDGGRTYGLDLPRIGTDRQPALRRRRPRLPRRPEFRGIRGALASVRQEPRQYADCCRR